MSSIHNTAGSQSGIVISTNNNILWYTISEKEEGKRIIIEEFDIPYSSVGVNHIIYKAWSVL